MAMKQLMRGRVQAKISAKAQTPAKLQSIKTAPKWREASLVGAATILAQVSPAFAEGEIEPSVVDTTIETVVGAVKSTGDFIKSGLGVVEAGVQLLQQGYDAASPVIEQGVKAISPVVEKAIGVASPTIQSALPKLQEYEQAIEASVKNETLDSVVGTANQAVSAATPYANQALSFLSSTDPVTLGKYGLGAFAFVYLGPPLLGVLAGLTRGYAGEITAPQVLDALTGNSVLIDMRTLKEKENSGIPDVPSSVSGKLIEVDFATIEDKKLRGSVRDANGVECAITALQIASLKRVGGGTKIILLDRYGPAARAVAKELARKGFGQCYTVAGGFDGGNGWVQSKLQIKPSAKALSSPALAARGPSFGSRKGLPAPRS